MQNHLGADGVCGLRLSSSCAAERGLASRVVGHTTITDALLGQVGNASGETDQQCESGG